MPLPKQPHKRRVEKNKATRKSAKKKAIISNASTKLTQTKTASELHKFGQDLSLQNIAAPEGPQKDLSSHGAQIDMNNGLKPEMLDHEVPHIVQKKKK